MKYPDSHAPAKTITAENQWPTRPRRFSPKRNSPSKLDSRKNENMPSMASVWPITPPANFENSEQLGPETRRAIVMLVSGAQRDRFQDHNEQRKTHRDLRKNIMEHHRKGELEAVNNERALHGGSLTGGHHTPSGAECRRERRCGEPGGYSCGGFTTHAVVALLRRSTERGTGKK